VMAMLATTYLGAIHSVVYAGLGVAALRERILDAGAKLLIAGDVSYRRGKGVDLRSIVEEAIRDLPLQVVWFQRAYKAELPEGHHDFQDL
ncbi:acetyl-coenzyme A synthetase, partial [Staphylococcus aureus]|nr:acetyl-coenzyme A synthetase [Staphylococcus aureus]